MNNYYTFAFIFYQVYLFELEHVIQVSIGSVALTCLQKQQFLQNMANVKSKLEWVQLYCLVTLSFRMSTNIHK